MFVIGLYVIVYSELCCRQWFCVTYTVNLSCSDFGPMMVFSINYEGLLKQDFKPLQYCSSLCPGSFAASEKDHFSLPRDF